MLVALSVPNPLGGVGQDIVGWLGRSISQGIGGFASWAINGVIHAMQATTNPDFGTWFSGPWRAMLTVVAWLSLPILFIGVGSAAVRGDLAAVLKRGLGAPVAMALGTAVALPVTAGVLTLVNACCGELVNVAVGGNQGFGQGLGRLSDFALSATLTSGANGLPGLAAALIVALAGLAALVIWFVLALRGALLYLEVLAIPLALCGLYWSGTAHWIKRLIDLIIATVISQLVITMLMVLAAADLNSGQLSGSNTSAVGGDMSTLFLCLAFLILGSLALPMALKHVPAATEHAAAVASHLGTPGRVSSMGNRVAGTAKAMGRSNGGGRAIVEAGSAAGALGLAASAGVGAATGAAKAGAQAAGGASGNQGSAPPSGGEPGTASSGGPASGGAARVGATSRSGNGNSGSTAGSSTAGAKEGEPTTSASSNAAGAAARAGRTPASPAPKPPGGSHG